MRQPTYPLIGIAGKAGSGKDVAAGFITTIFPQYYYRRAFADALKREALAAWASQGKLPFGPDIRELVTPQRFLVLADMVKVKEPAFRTFLQEYGQVQRTFDPNYWVTRLSIDHERSGERRGLVVPDVRYANEAQWVLDSGGVVLRIERPNHASALTTAQQAHASETELDDHEESSRYRIIENTGAPVSFLQRVLRALEG